VDTPIDPRPRAALSSSRSRDARSLESSDGANVHRDDVAVVVDGVDVDGTTAPR